MASLATCAGRSSTSASMRRQVDAVPAEVRRLDAPRRAASTTPGLPTPMPSSGRSAWAREPAAEVDDEIDRGLARSAPARSTSWRTTILPVRSTRAARIVVSSLRSTAIVSRASGTSPSSVAGLPTPRSARRPSSSTSPAASSSAISSDVAARVRWVARARSARLSGPSREIERSTSAWLCRRASPGTARRRSCPRRANGDALVRAGPR